MKKEITLITGSSRGIGKAAAIKFASLGHSVIINARTDSAQLQNTIHELEELNADYLVCIGDVSQPDVVSDIFSNIKSHYGTVDTLINNAGISYIGLMTEMSYDEWDAIISTNLSSAFYCCREAVPFMLSKKKGTIINISSVWGETGSSCETAYSASKGGVNAFTKALAKELAPSNIQVNAIAFGVIDTDMNNVFSEEERKALEYEIPAGHMASASEAADFIYQIAHADCYLTGQVITFDGGWQ